MGLQDEKTLLLSQVSVVNLNHKEEIEAYSATLSQLLYTVMTY